MTPMKEDDTTLRTILVIDDEKNMRHMLSAMLSGLGYRVKTACDGRDGLARIKENQYDFILCDIRMAGLDGLDFLRTAGDRIAESTVIMMSAYGSIDTAMEAMKLGAYDYISKPFKANEVHLALKKADERETLRRENRFLKETIRTLARKKAPDDIVGKSQRMEAVLAIAAKASRYATTVLITGESGTGKELVARRIHHHGPRCENPLVTVNCGSIPENLLESEFFGHKKGAFTGADRDRKGLFEEAHGGTIFLDEIGELSTSLQVKLLRVLQENEIRRVGGSRTRKIDVRVIAATARDLAAGTRDGSFREDLYYRLNVLSIAMPALRERAEDIPALCDFFIERHNRRLRTVVRKISSGAMACLLTYAWPGNVRELENCIERALVLCDDDVIEKRHLPSVVGEPRDADGERAPDGLSIKQARATVEKQLIRKALEKTGGNKTRAARLLEISHPSLLKKIRLYNI